MWGYAIYGFTSSVLKTGTSIQARGEDQGYPVYTQHPLYTQAPTHPPIRPPKAKKNATPARTLDSGVLCVGRGSL